MVGLWISHGLHVGCILHGLVEMQGCVGRVLECVIIHLGGAC